MEAVKLTVMICSFLLVFVSSAIELEEQKQSAFNFIGKLEGCHKGNNTKGILQLKHYLEKFGYLRYNQSNPHANDDEFDDLLEKAVKMYQRNYHMKATGALDLETVSQMVQPRCGVPDIIKSANPMMMLDRKRKKSHHQSGSLHTVRHYNFFPGNRKWPSNKYHLTYGFAPGTRSDAVNAVVRAFSKWATATHFTFTQAQTYESADLKIAFARGDHGDNYPFDGPRGTIAHAAAPTGGFFHYDADEQFSDGPAAGAFDLETVALHEIGHLLGLHHSDVKSAIMYSEITTGVTKALHDDDIQGIRALYNII